MLVFLYNLVWSTLIKREPVGAQPVALEVGRSGSCRRRCRCTTSTGSPCSTTTPIPTASSRPPGLAWHPPAEERSRWKHRHQPRLIPRSSSSRPSGSHGRCGSPPASSAARPRSSSSRSSSPTSTCARWTPTTIGRSGRCNPPVGFGVAIVVVLLLSAAALRVAATRPELTVPGRRRGAARSRCCRRAAGDRVDDARLRPGERRLRQRVHRVDRFLRGVRPRLRVLDRDAGRDGLAAASRRRARRPRRRC